MMLDANLVLREVEVLLDGHYTAWQQRPSGRVGVYERPQHAATVRQAAPALPKANGADHQAAGVAANRPAPAKPTDVSEVVTNVFLFVLLTILSEKFARRPAR
jgi:hypothetical protein